MDKRAAVISVSAIVLLLVSSLPIFVGSAAPAPSHRGAPAAGPVSPGSSAIVRALAQIDPDLAKAERGLSPARLADLQSIMLHSLAPAQVADRIEANAEHAATVQPAAYSTTGFDIEAISGLVATLCAVAGPETLGMGCLVGLAIVTGGLLIACAFSLWGICNSNAPNSVYAPAVALFEQILGQTNDWYGAGSQSINVTVQNYDSLTNETVGVWEYEAAAAALSQLGNASFNPVLDLGQSGIAVQAADTVYAVEYSSADDLLTTFANLAGVFGPGVGAGADGIVCQASAVTGVNYGFNGSAGQVSESGMPSALNVTGGTWGPDQKCQYGVTGNDLPNGRIGWGTTLPVANPYAVGVTNNSSLAYTLLNPMIPAGANGLESIFATAATHLDPHPHFFVTVPPIETNGYSVTPVATHMPAGAYFYNGTWACGGTYTACGTIPTGTNWRAGLLGITPQTPVIGTGFIPINRAVTAANAINHADGGTAFDTSLIANSQEDAFVTHSGIPFGQIGIACGPGTTRHGHLSIFEPDTQNPHVLPAISTCPGSEGYQIAALNALAMDASNVGAAYWAFLTGLGYTNVNQVPANCVIPPVESFLPPNYNVTSLGQLNATVLTGLAQEMLITLANTFGTGAPTFCGQHIRAPTNVSFPSQDVIAVGDIYVPGVAGQNFLVPTTWANTSVSLAIAPSDANLTIPVNKTWEAPGSNPSLVLYGNLSGPRDKTTKTQYVLTVKNASEAFTLVRGEYPHFTGNSSKPNGSVWPHDIYSRYGIGGALYLTTCYVRTAGKWAESTDCNYTVQSIHYNISADQCLLYATNCSVKPFPVTSGEDCGFAPVNEIASFFAGIPILGRFACLIGWVGLFIVAVLVLALVVAIWPRRRSS